ncbi:Uncharacterised protein [Legionella busanensis]|uniref:Transmembrane protein n=1 Tax=Legionella busanensis TaxID=190655 RepID=A0A378JL83_9GAMM|nr:hypothetical protein [Legionella busanensis]STX50979.1 Uncharacterised protein [Legionella busanensis]
MRSLRFLAKPFTDYIIYTKGYPKITYHIVIPLILTLLLTCFGTSDSKALITSGYTILTFISAFSFAAIISFSKLNSEQLLEKIWGNKIMSPEVIPITFQTYRNSHKIEVELSRKAFIALLLGYICFTSTALLLALVIFNSISIHFSLIKSIAKFLFFWSFFSLLINVMYAIQYFTKINLEEALSNSNKNK